MSTRRYIILLAFLLALSIVYVVEKILAKPKTITVTAPDPRVGRICADVDLKLKLANTWGQTPDRTDMAKTVIITLEGVRAICAESEQ